MLQEGIYFDKGQTPGRCFAIAFLRAQQGATAEQVGLLMGQIWKTCQNLKQGKVSDLPDVEVPASGLSVLVGYGPKAFALPGAQLSLPEGLQTRFQFRSPLQGGGNPILIGTRLNYLQGLQRNLATEEIALQFIGDTPLAVSRAIVEIWKVLQDNINPQMGEAALSISGSFMGFNREDHRSWIDFHDGVSNLPSGDPRRQVLEIKPETAGNDTWTIGGTYLAFLRLPVDLKTWRSLPRPEQELLVGRDKLTGCALTQLDLQGQSTPVSGCPFTGTRSVIEPGNESFREAPQAVAPTLQKSHIQRVNQVKDGNLSNPSSFRIFRQGYEFMDGIEGGELVLGLNFVSFQDSPKRIMGILSQRSWMQEVNFGGDASTVPPGAPELLKVQAAGIYLVPPVIETEQFPGQNILMPLA
jgi:deferrochelatase/peroxidase EfeB